MYAGSQFVGRIYQTHLTGSSETWFWGVNGLTFDLSIGAVMHGHATDFQDAKAKLRAAFERWLVWATAIPKEDLKHRAVSDETKRMETLTQGVGCG